MHLQDTPEDLAFRAEVRTFVERHLPADIRDAVLQFRRVERDDYVAWQKILHGRGWGAPGWPKEHGGTGWNARQRSIFEEECFLAGAPRQMPFGLSMVDTAGNVQVVDPASCAATVPFACTSIYDAVSWSSSTTGASSQVKPGSYTTTANDSAASFCPGTATYGNAGNLGTPGSVKFQFERKGYYFADPKDWKEGAPVFNLVVPLRDTWGKGGGGA